MNRKVMISQPMNGKTNEEIREERAELVRRFEEEGMEVVDTIRGTLLCIPVKDGLQGIFANIEDIIKASDKLIDLICEGDYINGFRVLEIMKNNRKEEPSTMVYCEFGNSFIGYYNEDIKSIVTKEMFEQMSYKVGEWNEFIKKNH